MTELWHTIDYYENILAAKENTGNALNMDEVNNWQLCRTCLTETTESDIDLDKLCIMDEQEGRLLSLQEMLKKMGNVESTGHNNNLPLKVCIQCSEKIKSYYYFTKQVGKTENILKLMAQKLNMEITNDCTGTATNILSNYKNAKSNKIANKSDVQNAKTYTIQHSPSLCQVKDEAINDIRQHNVPDHLKRNSDNNSIFIKQEQQLIMNEIYSITEILEAQNDEEISESIKLEDCLLKDTSDSQDTDMQTDGYISESSRQIKSNKKKSYFKLPNSFDNKCAICQRIFKHRKSFIKHVRQYHPKGKAFKCPHCGKLFSDLYNLYRHNKSNHKNKDIKKQNCKICSKSYRSSDMIIHLRTHTGERPFPCSLCEKTFSSKSGLVAHQKTHYDNDMFRKHICEYCFKSFTKSNDLTRHLRLHTGERPFSCSMCERAFTVKSTLMSHLKTHEKPYKPRPYTCLLCNKAYKDQSGLRKHIKSIHNKSET